MSDVINVAMLEAFVTEHRNRFASSEADNTFAFNVAGVVRCAQFLAIIHERYEIAAREMKQTSRQLLGLPSGPLSEDAQAAWVKGRDTTVRVHLEIESFYLFAKMLLDRVAHALETLFGAARGVSMNSHDQFTKAALRFVQFHRLDVSPSLVDQLTALKTSVSDHRDYEISHLRHPRAAWGSIYQLDTDDADVKIARAAIYPSERDRSVESQPLPELVSMLNTYLDTFMEIVSRNFDKIRLDPKRDTK